MTAVTTTSAERFLRYVNLSAVGGVEPIAVDRGKGAELWDVDGRRYLDCFAGISVVSTGHAHPRVVEAAREQMERFIHCGSYLYQVPVVGELAARLAEVTPGRLEKTFFSNSGAEAVEGAMRLARAFTGRSEFIALQTGFHGRTNATLAVTGNRKRKQHGGPYLGGVAFAPAPHPLRCRMCDGRCSLACADAVEDVVDYQTSGNVAAFIAEPVLGEAGIVVPHRDYFRRVKEILDARGILLIVDEVQTGFARTGRMFAIEHYGVEPDIMTMAKGIASGFPLGGFIARPTGRRLLPAGRAPLDVRRQPGGLRCRTGHAAGHRGRTALRQQRAPRRLVGRQACGAGGPAPGDRRCSRQGPDGGS